MKQLMFKSLAILILSFSVAVGWLWMGFNGFMDNRISLPKSGLDIRIERGATFTSLSRELYQQGVFRSLFYPRLVASIYPELTQLKRGEYHLDQDMTARDVFTKLTKGEVINYQVRFIEGWTFADFINELVTQEALKSHLIGMSRKEIAKRLSIEQINPEGWFYPDTYNFPRGMSDLQILQIAHDNMKQKLDHYWQERDLDLPYDNPYQVLIMASIIEKETGLAGERNRIAGVFVRRLNKNMRLQTDPTVIYGLGKTFNGDLTRRDLRTNTAYNTYLNKGLPPTPIAMPSAASMSAAVHPADGTELYFVARGDGSHQFSTSLEQHNRAVRLYQLKDKSTQRK